MKITRSKLALLAAVMMVGWQARAEMVLIPAGSFVMGATTNMGHESYSDEIPQHTVSLSAFYMENYEVTKALWDEVYSWATSHGYSFDNTGSGKAANHPTHTVNWYDCVKWCNARSEKEGLTPCYYTTSAQTTIYRTGNSDISSDCVKWGANGYRLPTEAEWEKAARGGSAGHRFPWTDADTITHSRANYSSSSGYAYDVSPTRGYHPDYDDGGTPYTSPVGSFAANGYGLSDMAGNVCEWCWDWYDLSWYSNAGATQSDTHGPTTSTNRVIRGGGWVYYAYLCRAADRFYSGSPVYECDYIGFRCARGIGGGGSAGTLQFSASSASVNEDAGSVSLTVTRSGGSSGAASVHYATANGTASAGTDYTATSGQLNWVDGNSDSKTITVPIINRSGTQDSRTFTVALSGASGATLGSPTSCAVTIMDIEASLTNGLVGYWPMDGNASDLSVYSNNGTVHGAISYADGAVNQAAIFDQPGTKYIEISHQSQYVLTNTYTVSLWFKSNTSDGGTGKRILQKAWPACGDGTRNTWEILWGNGIIGPVWSVGWSWCDTESLHATQSFAMTAWNHFAFTYDLASNELREYVNGVWVTNKSPSHLMAPLDTTLSLLFMNDRYGSDYDAVGMLDEVRIYNRALSAAEISELYSTNSVSPGTLQFSASSASVNENAGSVTLTVTRSGGSSGAASVNYATANGTASAGTDYTATSGTLNWDDGNSDSKTITVPISNRSGTQANRTFTVTLSSASGASLGSPTTNTVTINDVGSAGTLQFDVSSTSVNENAGSVSLTVTRIGGSSGAASVNYATANGTAVAGTDYTDTSGTLNWVDGNSDSKTITVPVINRAGTQDNRTFTVNLSGASGATLGSPASVTVTIADDGVVTGDFMVIDVSSGPSASSYPVSSLSAVPPGGWTEEYKTTKIVLRKIPAGTYTMGSPEGELGRQSDETQHQVALTKDVYIGVFEVTQKQWERVMGNWPSYFTNATYRDFRPVESVSYYDIRENPANSAISPNWPQSAQVHADSFMGKLRAKTGLTTLDLPTESQWEYACRAGITTALNSGYNLTNEFEDTQMDVVGRYWYNGHSGYSQNCTPSAGTATVGSYLVNQWGLFDMHGNVCEWCLDSYGRYPGIVTDPVGAESGLYRVLRGGDWCTIAYNCRSAVRYCYLPSVRCDFVGFRLARPLDGSVFNPGTLQFSASSASVNENAGSVILTVTRTGGSSGAASVHYATANGTASAGTDYTATSGQLNWVDGNSDSKTITVPIINRSGTQGSRTFAVNLSNASGASVGSPSSVTVTINDVSSDSAGTIQFNASRMSVSENASVCLLLYVTRSNGNSGAASVNYATVNGTASAGTDYTATSGTLNWDDRNSDTKLIEVEIIDDSIADGNKSFTVTLANASGASLGLPSSAAVTIVDNEPSIPKRYALLIGINKYLYQNELYGCINDAYGIKDRMLLADPDERWDESNIKLLTDNKADKTSIRSSLHQLANIACAGDIVLYFQSSHGGWIDGYLYYDAWLCTYDIDYSPDELAEDLADFDPGVKIVVVLDACHSGGMHTVTVWPFAEKTLNAYRNIKIKQYASLGFMIPKELGTNIAFMTACRSYESTLERYNLWQLLFNKVYGIYTRCLIKASDNTSSDSNNNGTYEFSEIHLSAAEWALDENPDQHATTHNDILLSQIAVRSVKRLSLQGSLNITANGQDNAISIGQGAQLSVKISLSTGAANSINNTDEIKCDYWIAVDTPFGRYCYLYDGNGYQWYNTDVVNNEMVPAYMGSLMNLSPLEVLSINTSLLPKGGYTFYFGIDTCIDGVLDFDELYYDAVSVNIY